jgi:hypothetical protein
MSTIKSTSRPPIIPEEAQYDYVGKTVKVEGINDTLAILEEYDTRKY